jgi:hypothetical protein
LSWEYMSLNPAEGDVAKKSSRYSKVENGLLLLVSSSTKRGYAKSESQRRSDERCRGRKSSPCAETPESPLRTLISHVEPLRWVAKTTKLVPSPWKLGFVDAVIAKVEAGDRGSSRTTRGPAPVARRKTMLLHPIR